MGRAGIMMGFKNGLIQESECLGHLLKYLMLLCAHLFQFLLQIGPFFFLPRLMEDTLGSNSFGV